jgi:hypothetical protein
MNKSAKYYISKLQLLPHPEGGYYREVYRSDDVIEAGYLPKRYKTKRTSSTSIYFLLEGEQVSRLHKLNSDEIWHYYDGCPARIYNIDEKGELTEVTIGRNLEQGESLQVLIKRNTWFGAELKDKTSFCIVGCTVSPGFEFDDLELADRKKLLKLYPFHEEIIKKLTKFDK